jgi:hypothetical protein
MTLTPARYADPRRHCCMGSKPGPASPPKVGLQPAVHGRALEARQPKPLCCHCHARPITRRRNLCQACYYTPAIRAATPVVNYYGKRGVGGSAGPHPPPSRPTKARPGGKGKLAVLAARAQAGQELFHPADRNALAGRSLHGSSSCRRSATVSRETL